MTLQLTKLENRFQRLGSYPYEQCVRDLGTLVDRLNALEGEITDQVAQELADLAASIAAGLAGTLADYLTTADAATIYETQTHAAATYVTAAGLSLALAAYTTTADLTTLLAAKQAVATVLTNLSAVGWVAGDLIGFSAANTPSRIAKGTSQQLLRMNAAATGQEYVDPGNAIYLGELGGGVDLDSLTTSGFWHQTDDSEAASGSHYPIAKAGKLEVRGGFGVSGVVYQEYFAFVSQLRFTRVKVSGVWGAWKCQSNSVYFYAQMASNTAISGFSLPTTFTNIIMDSHGYFASSKFTPQIPGVYWISGVEATDNYSGDAWAQIYKNGSSAASGGRNNFSPAATSGITYVTAAGLVQLNGSTDYVQLGCYGSSCTLLANRTHIEGFLVA